MKIIIVGLGQTGNLLISSLANENYDVVVIDQDRKLVDAATDRYNVNGVVGSGASRETLLSAGADTADAIVALTHTDGSSAVSTTGWISISYSLTWATSRNPLTRNIRRNRT